MRTIGTSVPEAVREIISRNRSIYDCMMMDLINYTALAVKIQPDVESILGNKVNLNTIVVAIKRYADRLAEEEIPKEEPILKNARVTLTDGMMDVRFSTNEFDQQGGAPEVLRRFAKAGRDYEFFRFSDSFRFLAEDMEVVKEIFRSMQEGKTNDNMFSTGLAKIRVVVDTPNNGSPSDALSHVADILHTAGIDLVNAYFGQDDIIIIVREKDAVRAYGVLRDGIRRA